MALGLSSRVCRPLLGLGALLTACGGVVAPEGTGGSGGGSESGGNSSGSTTIMPAPVGSSGTTTTGSTGGSSGSSGGGGSSAGSTGGTSPTPTFPLDKQLWTSVASDASGQNLVATTTLVVPAIDVESGFWTSHDGGGTWSYANGPADLSAVASNSSGSVLLAGASDIWTLASGPADWVPIAESDTWTTWSSLASDASGVHLVGAGGIFGDLWTSSDSGLTWTDRTASGAGHRASWVSVGSDLTGRYLVAAAGGGEAMQGTGATGDLWTSQDYGVTWTVRSGAADAPPAAHWDAVASDASGQNLVAVGPAVWTSTDAGASWTQQVGPSGLLDSVASDSTGTRLVGSSYGGDVWTSHDAGATWTNETVGTAFSGENWMSVASNAAGNHLVAVASRDAMWIKSE